MYRDLTKIIRKYDEKLLGEWVSYHRGGGEFPGPWIPTSFSCPAIKNTSPLGLYIQFLFLRDQNDQF